MEPQQELRKLALEEALRQNTALAHFDLDQFTGPGQILEDMRGILEEWYANLKHHGFDYK